MTGDCALVTWAVSVFNKPAIARIIMILMTKYFFLGLKCNEVLQGMRIVLVKPKGKDGYYSEDKGKQ